MHIIVNIKNNYGTRAIYPVCAKARNFAAIAGTVTLTDSAIRNIKLLGYTINVETQTI
jgi:hypothetical protein